MIKNIIFSTLIIGLSALTCFTIFGQDTITSQNYLSVLNCGIGLFAVLCLLGNQTLNRFLVFIWIILQLLVIRLNVGIPINPEDIGLDSFVLKEIDFVQFFGFFPEALTFEFLGNAFLVNVLPFAFFLIYFIPESRSSGSGAVYQHPIKVGEAFDLKLYRWNKMMEHALPQRIELLQKLDFEDNKNWFLVRLSKPIKFRNGKVIYNALIKPKEGREFIKNQPGQLAYFHLVANKKDIRLNKTKFIDWVFVK